MRSTVLAEGGEDMVQTEMTQSMPAVMRVRESTKAAAEIWPMCIPSTRPTSWKRPNVRFHVEYEKVCAA